MMVIDYDECNWLFWWGHWDHDSCKVLNLSLQGESWFQISFAKFDDTFGDVAQIKVDFTFAMNPIVGFQIRMMNINNIRFGQVFNGKDKWMSWSKTRKKSAGLRWAWSGNQHSPRKISAHKRLVHELEIGLRRESAPQSIQWTKSDMNHKW